MYALSVRRETQEEIEKQKGGGGGEGRRKGLKNVLDPVHAYASTKKHRPDTVLLQPKDVADHCVVIVCCVEQHSTPPDKCIGCAEHE